MVVSDTPCPVTSTSTDRAPAELAPRVHSIWVEVELVTVQSVSPTATLTIPETKPVPVMVRVCPGFPLAGLMEVIVGVAEES